jgi:hypothetical protein
LETPAFNVLVLIAFGLMVIISGGVGYLTLAEWRDRRRRDRELRGDRPISSRTDKADSLPSASMARKTSKGKSKAKK